MMADEIIAEVWRIKDEIAREHGYDVDRLGAYFRERERQRAQRERKSAGTAEGTAEGTAAGDAGAVTWVDAKFGAQRAGGTDRSGS